MVLWDTSPPSSRSAGFLNKVTIPCPNTSSLDLLACRVVSSTSLDSVMNAIFKVLAGRFPGGAVVKNLPANAGDRGSSPGLGRSHVLHSN